MVTVIAVVVKLDLILLFGYNSFSITTNYKLVIICILLFCIILLAKICITHTYVHITFIVSQNVTKLSEIFEQCELLLLKILSQQIISP